MKAEWKEWEYGQIMLEEGDIKSLDEWSMDKEMVGQICDRIFDYMWDYSNGIRLVDRLYAGYENPDGTFSEDGYVEYKERYGESARDRRVCVLHFNSFEDLWKYFLSKLIRIKGCKEERAWIRERLKLNN